jgi:hypothetical protein
MKYVIEDGIPAPEKVKRTIPPKGPIRQTLEAMKPGQSVLLDTAREYDQARSAATYIGSFVCRKVPGKGWRVWRTA